jgi:hypothetical protein
MTTETQPGQPDQPHQPAPTEPGQPNPEPAPGTVLPADDPDEDSDATQEEGEKYDGGDIPQTGTESAENQNTENQTT